MSPIINLLLAILGLLATWFYPQLPGGPPFDSEMFGKILEWLFKLAIGWNVKAALVKSPIPSFRQLLVGTKVMRLDQNRMRLPVVVKDMLDTTRFSELCRRYSLTGEVLPTGSYRVRRCKGDVVILDQTFSTLDDLERAFLNR